MTEAEGDTDAVWLDEKEVLGVMLGVAESDAVGVTNEALGVALSVGDRDPDVEAVGAADPV